MINELFVLEILIFFTLSFFTGVINIMSLWYLGGLYLVFLGIFLLLDDADIFVGFLWVIDLGVGLIFFIFILHFSNFLQQKATFDLTSKFFFSFLFFIFFIFHFFYFFSSPSDENFNSTLKKIWFFLISWYDYYDFTSTYTVTELNTLREMYFFTNSFGFFIVNFMIFYGIFASVNLCFLIKRVFSFLSFPQIKNLGLLADNKSVFFIRNQNFLKQQNTSAGTRVWSKKKKNTL